MFKLAKRTDRMAGHVLQGMLSSGAWDEAPGRQGHCVAGKNCTFLLLQAKACDEQTAAVAREVATASLVLLKNQAHVLPITPAASVALVGSACSNPFLRGRPQWDVGDYYTLGGSGRVMSDEKVSSTVTQGLQAALKQGLISRLTIESSDKVSAALKAAKKADVVLTCGGATATESLDRPSLRLDQHQYLVELSEKLAATRGKKTPLVVVALTPGVFVADGWEPGASSVLAGFLLGQVQVHTPPTVCCCLSPAPPLWIFAWLPTLHRRRDEPSPTF